MFYRCHSGNDRSKMAFLSSFIVGQMAMIVPSWCSTMFYHWPNGDDWFKLVFRHDDDVLSMTVLRWCSSHVLPLL